MMQRKSNSGKSFWKWRNRSTKSASESDAREMSFASPMTSMSVPPNFKPFEQPLQRQPASPFVSESAHVFSLQHPTTTLLSNQAREDRESSSVSPGMGSSSSISPMSVADTVRKATTVPSSPSSTIGLYDKAKKSIESKLKFRTRKEVVEFRASMIGKQTDKASVAHAPRFPSMSALTQPWTGPEITTVCIKSQSREPGLKMTLGK
jgi:hypothetical protein